MLKIKNYKICFVFIIAILILYSSMCFALTPIHDYFDSLLSNSGMQMPVNYTYQDNESMQQYIEGLNVYNINGSHDSNWSTFINSRITVGFQDAVMWSVPFGSSDLNLNNQFYNEQTNINESAVDEFDQGILGQPDNFSDLYNSYINGGSNGLTGINIPTMSITDLETCIGIILGLLAVAVVGRAIYNSMIKV